MAAHRAGQTHRLGQCKGLLSLSALYGPLPLAHHRIARGCVQEISVKLPLKALAATLCAAALASGCVIAPVGTRYVEPGEIVTTAPPPAQYEAYGVAPAVGMVWLGGYWGWGGGRYTWHSGYWAHPRAGHTWVPHSWAPVRGGWVHRPGYWRRH